MIWHYNSPILVLVLVSSSVSLQLRHTRPHFWNTHVFGTHNAVFGVEHGPMGEKIWALEAREDTNPGTNRATMLFQDCAGTGMHSTAGCYGSCRYSSAPFSKPCMHMVWNKGTESPSRSGKTRLTVRHLQPIHWAFDLRCRASGCHASSAGLETIEWDYLCALSKMNHPAGILTDEVSLIVICICRQAGWARRALEASKACK